MITLKEARKTVSDIRTWNCEYFADLQERFDGGEIEDDLYLDVEHLLQIYDEALDPICAVDDALYEGKLPSEDYLDEVSDYSVVQGIPESDLVPFESQRAEEICTMLETRMAEVESYIP